MVIFSISVGAIYPFSYQKYFFVFKQIHFSQCSVKKSFKLDGKMKYVEGFSVLNTENAFLEAQNKCESERREGNISSIIITQVLPGGPVARQISEEKRCYFPMVYVSLKNKMWVC